MPSNKSLEGNGQDLSLLLQNYLNKTADRDAVIERIANSVHSLSNEFSRKLDEAERDTRKQFDQFSTNVGSQFQSIVTKFETALATRDAKLEAISAEFLKSRQAPWAILIAFSMFILTLGGSVGWLAYNPINSRTSKIEDALVKLADSQLDMKDWSLDKFVTQKDLDARTDRGKEDRDRTNREIENIQANIFTRDVHKQHWDNINESIKATNDRTDAARMDLQRQIDAIQKNLGDTYTTRDALLESKQRLDKLEDLVRQLIADKGARPSTP